MVVGEDRVKLKIAYRTYNSGGKGGQNSNRSFNAVEASVTLPDGTTLSASSEMKSQLQNKKLARSVLLSRVRDHLRPEGPERFAAGKERVRTYHELDDRVTDHRSGRKFSYRQTVGKGDLSEVIEHLN